MAGDPLAPVEALAGQDEVLDVLGAWSVTAAGEVTLCSYNDDLTLASRGESTSVFIDATGLTSIGAGTAQMVFEAGEVAGQVSVMSGEAGTILLQSGLPDLGSMTTLEAEETTIQVGVPDVGSAIQLTPESISLSVGPPGAGASIKMTPESITLQVGEVILTLSLEGITEDVLTSTREVTAEGHNMTAAETEFNIGVSGITAEAPLMTTEAEASLTVNSALITEAADAMKSQEAAMTTIE